MSCLHYVRLPGEASCGKVLAQDIDNGIFLFLETIVQLLVKPLLGGRADMVDYISKANSRSAKVPGG